MYLTNKFHQYTSCKQNDPEYTEARWLSSRLSFVTRSAEEPLRMEYEQELAAVCTAYSSYSDCGVL